MFINNNEREKHADQIKADGDKWKNEYCSQMSKLDRTKRCLLEMSRVLPSEVYLRYRKSLAQCSSLEGLELIGKSLITEICR